MRRATENLTCPVCCQLFKSPRCYHSYCEECLEKIKKQSVITCPECRQEAAVPPGGIKELPNNFLINRLVDDLVLNRKDEETVSCDECNNDETISGYCPNCNLFLCCSCYDAHKATASCHEISTVSLAGSSRSSSQSSEFVCEEHGYELKHYCETCDKLVCLYCAVKQHNDHNHDTVKKMAGKQRNEMKQISAPLEVVAENLVKAHDNVDNLKSRTQEQGEEINAKIDQHFDKLIQKLMAQKEQLKKELSVAITQVGKMANAQEEEINSVQEKLSSVKELNSFIEEGSDQQALSTKCQLVDGMKELDSVFKKLCLQPAPSCVISYASADELPQFGQLSVFGEPFSLGDLTNSKIENIPKHVFEGKEIKLKIISKDCNGQKCPIGGCQVCVRLEYVVGGVTAACIMDNNDGSYMASFVAEQVGEAKLSVSINGEQIKASPHHFTVFKNYPSLQNATTTVGVDDNISLGNPWGIAFSESGLWAVTDNSNHCVCIFDNKNQLVRKIGQAGTRKGQFRSPRGIAFDNTDHLYIVDHGNNRVQKFSTLGQHLLQLDTYAFTLGTRFYKMTSPTGITTYDDRIYVTEKTNNKGYISVFLSSGRFCFSIGSKELSDPYDVTVRCDGQLLVADCVKNSVYIYTPDGVYLCKFSTGGTARGQLNSPFSLITDSSLFVFVADTWNHRVTIFDKDGNHVHCFGSEGCAKHQFKRPHGVALSPQGQLYVSDHGNSRIQIF